MDIRGGYRFRSLVKQNKKAKICFVIHIAGEKKLLFYIYSVIVKQKFINGPQSLLTVSPHHPHTCPPDVPARLVYQRILVNTYCTSDLCRPRGLARPPSACGDRRALPSPAVVPVSTSLVLVATNLNYPYYYLYRNFNPHYLGKYRSVFNDTNIKMKHFVWQI